MCKKLKDREVSDIIQVKFRLIKVKEIVGGILSNEDSGICALFREQHIPRVTREGRLQEHVKCSIMQDVLVEACKHLGVYSGGSTYPIRHPHRTPWVAFENCSKWTILTKYGRTRRAVLNKCISLLQEEIDQREGVQVWKIS